MGFKSSPERFFYTTFLKVWDEDEVGEKGLEDLQETQESLGGGPQHS